MTFCTGALGVTSVHVHELRYDLETFCNAHCIGSFETHANSDELSLGNPQRPVIFRTNGPNNDGLL